ncbi:oligosaccharide flippase family protein [Bacillus sp. JJ1562]|uniref:oligosaccharide flippase family protein n=1 Tax=Bacillus sp. JJ1562 TaxID=3122960 RepID=UPI003F689816
MPVITIPYLSRALGPEGIGMNAYSLSVVQIFVLFSVVGIPLYGNRQIASAKDSGQGKLSREFWSLYLIQIVTSLIVMIIYLLFVFLTIDNYRSIFISQLFILLASMIDISWFYIGLEELKKTIIRNATVRIVSLLLIFIFIKQPDDLLNYMYINGITQFIGQAVLWVHLNKYVKPTRIKRTDIIRHLKPMFIIFSSQIIIHVYIVLDKVLLGVFVNEKEVGFYEQALKIINLSLSFIFSLGIVMLPRIASEFSRGNHEKIKHYNHFSMKFILFLTLPLMVGMASVADTLVPWFLGPGYEKVVILIVIMSPIIVFIGFSNLFGIQILLPTQQQNKLTISVAVGAAVSIIVNILLIKKYESLGTAIATLIAEASVMLVQFLYVFKLIELKELMKSFMKYGLLSALMGLVVFIMGYFLHNATLLVPLIQVGAGIFIYLGILLLIKDDFLFSIINKVSNGRIRKTGD